MFLNHFPPTGKGPMRGPDVRGFLESGQIRVGNECTATKSKKGVGTSIIFDT
jgi:hypothetical protein